MRQAAQPFADSGMRVAAIVHQFPPDFQTGTEILCLTTMQELQRRGAQTLVIAADPRIRRGGRARESVVGGLHTVFIPAAEPRRWSLTDELGDEFRRQELARAVLQHLSAFRPDIVHVHHIFRFGAECLSAVAETYPSVYTATDFALSCRYAIAMLPSGAICEGPDGDGRNCVEHYLTRPSAIGLPRAQTLRVGLERGFDRLSHGGRQALRNEVQRLHARQRRAVLVFASACRRVMVSSEHLRASLLRIGIPAERLMVVPHSVPEPGPAAPETARIGQPLRIGYFGSLSAHKGPHILMQAVQRIPRDAACEIVIRGNLSGGNAYLGRLRRLAGADARIRIAPPVPMDRFGDALTEVDIVVIPSLWAENAPLVLLSAIKRKRYLVISDVPGLTAPAQPVIHKTVVPANDDRALACALERLIRDPTPVRLARSETTAIGAFADYVDTLEGIYAKALAPQ